MLTLLFICISIKYNFILQGILYYKCSLKKQLPTLRLLLDFMRKVYIEPFVNKNETEETFMNVIKVC